MTLVVATDVTEVRRAVAVARGRELRIGLVPTMGALHEGHIRLIRAARRDTGLVVLSLFVNPTQFGPKEDLARYPRPFEDDLAICRAEGVDLVFAPALQTIYPDGYSTYVEVHGMQDVLEGASRPGHFRGVCTVVVKLFNLVAPDVAYFGQKDAQQVVVIKRMVEDLNVPVEVRVCPTVREKDGLALSSRNVYLDAAQRRDAVALSRSLAEARTRIEAGERDAEVVRHGIEQHIGATPGAVLDYAAVVDARTLRSIDRVEGTVLMALAVRFGATRLIDNLVLSIIGTDVSGASL